MEGIGKYFSKKRNLSDQSQGEDEKKKKKYRKEVQQVLLTIPMFLVKDWSQLNVRLFY